MLASALAGALAMGAALALDLSGTLTRPDDATVDARYRAVQCAPGTILAATEIADDGSTNVLGGDENLARAGDAWAAASNLPTPAAGVIRRFTESIAGLDAMAVRSSENLTGGRPPSGLFSGGGALIDYRGPPGTIPTVSSSDVLLGRVPARRIAGRIAVIGASAPTLQDVHPTPTSDRPMSGPRDPGGRFTTPDVGGAFDGGAG